MDITFTTCKIHFNTSNVMVLLQMVVLISTTINNFNTSNVMVLLYIGVNHGLYVDISIHPMLWFFFSSWLTSFNWCSNFNTSNVMVLLYLNFALNSLSYYFNTSNIMVLPKISIKDNFLLTRFQYIQCYGSSLLQINPSYA